MQSLNEKNCEQSIRDKVSSIFLLRRAKIEGLATEALALFNSSDDSATQTTDWTLVRSGLEKLLARGQTT